MKTNEKFLSIEEMITKSESILAVCNKEIEYMSHPEKYGCCISKCNSIVINKERMMTVTTDETHHTTYEFTPLYPTYFSPEAAREIVENDIYRDINDNRIEMEIIGKMEYYTLLKKWTEDSLSTLRSINQ